MCKSDIRQQMLSSCQLGNLRSKTIEVLNLHVVDGKNNDTRKETKTKNCFHSAAAPRQLYFSLSIRKARSSY